MRGRLAALVTLVFLAIPARVFAKADLTKITIAGGDLKAPIEITDPKTLAKFDVWSGPGTSWTGNSSKQADKFIIDWSQRVTEPPEALQRYEVSFYAKLPNEKVVYVVFYEYDPATEHGYTYLPGRTEEWYRLNVSTILHGVEGRWFRASSEWNNFAKQLIAGALRQELQRFIPFRSVSRLTPLESAC